MKIKEIYRVNKTEEPRTKFLAVRLTETERDYTIAAAERKGMSISEYIRYCLNSQAQREN